MIAVCAGMNDYIILVQVVYKLYVIKKTGKAANKDPDYDLHANAFYI